MWTHTEEFLSKAFDKLCDKFYADEINEVEFQKKAAEIGIKWATMEIGLHTSVDRTALNVRGLPVEMVNNHEPSPVLVDVVERPQQDFRDALQPWQPKGE
jgi:hypothetical protein